MRNARKYTKRIELWQSVSVPDTFGGNTVTDVLITKSWAKIENASGNSRYVSRMKDLGINDPANAIIVKVKHRNDISYNAVNQFIKYRGVDYYIQNAPLNIDYINNEVEIIATRQALQSVNIIP